MPAANPAPRVVVSKFRSLFQSDVAEVIESTAEAFLAHLAIEPGEAWSGDGHAGWSPVEYEPGKRSRDNVRRVYCLVLDYDKGGDWAALSEYWREFECCIYTTKSHGVGTGDRVRVVLPLLRPVSGDEYARLWDWGARVSPCPADKQAKDPSRFWYEPTLPPGGWRAELWRGATIDPDAVLAMARPAAPPPRPAPASTSSEQRVRRAQAWLAKVPGAVSGSGGHTATFNAVASVLVGFDLPVSDARQLIDVWNQTCEPPWSAEDLDHKFASVAARCQRERGYLLTERQRFDAGRSPAANAPPLPAELDADWAQLLLLKPDKTPRKASTNVEVYVRHHPDYRGRWSLDQMSGGAWLDDGPVTDIVIHDVRNAVERVLGFTPTTEHLVAAIGKAAADRPFHPVLQYLRSLDWDGRPRLQHMAQDFLLSDSPVHAEMVRRWMIGACARVLRPGCKLDTALMLVGAQGIGKSTFFSVLGGKWHADTYIDITSKDGLIQLHSAWLYEMSELENVLSGRSESRMKAWMTSSTDLYRAPYSRTLEAKPRAVVLCGTTNRAEFLTDDTGSRRYWIIPVRGAIDSALLADTRDQLWAEALAAAEAGERWWLDSDTSQSVESANRDFNESDAWAVPVAEWLARPDKASVAVHEVLEHALRVEVSRQDRQAQMRCVKILKQLGWQRYRHNESGSRSWRYRRADAGT